MNTETIQSLMPLLLSVATPHVAALLNDPRPGRRWLRVTVSILLVAGGAAIEQAQSGAWDWAGYLRSVGTLFVGSQGVFRLLRDAYLGKLEIATGNGLGVLLDMGKSKPSVGGEVASRLAEIQGLYQAGVLTKDEYEAKRAEIVGAI